MAERVDLDPPVDPGVNCQHCYEPIVAVALVRDGLVRRPDWRHRDGLRPQCTIRRLAEPRQYTAALMRVESHLAARRDAEVALAAALGNHTAKEREHGA